MKKRKKSFMPRDKNKLAIIRREARGNTTSVPSKKAFKRHPKHRNSAWD